MNHEELQLRELDIIALRVKSRRLLALSLRMLSKGKPAALRASYRGRIADLAADRIASVVNRERCQATREGLVLYYATGELFETSGQSVYKAYCANCDWVRTGDRSSVRTLAHAHTMLSIWVSAELPPFHSVNGRTDQWVSADGTWTIDKGCMWGLSNSQAGTYWTLRDLDRVTETLAEELLREATS